MDKLTEQNIEEKKEKETLFDRIGAFFTGEKQQRAEDKRALIYDLLLFSVGFILARCHLLFGARPLGMAFVAMLPVGVWPALFGSALGSLTLGVDGIIFAAASAIIVFLRAALSVGGKSNNINEHLFKENLLLRMSISVIGGFLTALYEVIISGLNETSLLFGLSMVLLPPALVFVFSGSFSSGITICSIIESKADIFSLSGKTEREKYNIIFFQLSSLMLLFFISLSLGKVNIFGISCAYIFSSAVTLLAAKRFGALRGMAVGFVTTLGISGTLSVSFALAGLGAGIMFGFGTGYAIIAGGAALSAWSVYSGGLMGFLSTFPEYVIAASISLPLLKKISKEEQVIKDTPEPKRRRRIWSALWRWHIRTNIREAWIRLSWRSRRFRALSGATQMTALRCCRLTNTEA